MGLKTYYTTNKRRLLEDSSINQANRALFQKFFEFEEYKLKRTNGMPAVDERSYKTLLGYITKLRNVNRWFDNKPWVTLTEADIRRVYDALEDGKIKTSSGRPLRDTKSYYNKVFRSKPFDLAGKADMARKVIEFYHNKAEDEVRFIEEDTFRRMVSVVTTPHHKLLLWLAFDIGENINTLLVLQKKDFVRRINSDSQEAEYIVNLAKEKLKRSRKARSEITNFSETVQLLEMILKNLRDEDKVFTFEHRQALKFIDRAVRITGARCIPKGQKVSWKDLRSSMACFLLNKGWTTDEIRARLGHSPSSRVLDKYVNYLAIGRHTAKKKFDQSNLQELKQRLDESRGREKLMAQRIAQVQSEFEEFKLEVEKRLDASSEYREKARQLAEKPDIRPKRRQFHRG